MTTIDITSSLGQFAWRQVTSSTIPLPVIFRNDNREEYLCVQMINIHLLSKFSSELIKYCMKQRPIQYFSLTKSEAKLFQYINQFHSNEYLGKFNQLNYSQLDSIYITPFQSFVQFYEFISSKNTLYFLSSLNISKSTNSYCRKIIFHEKEIMSYSSTPILNSNKTILCLSVKDIVSIYFPWTTSKEFIRLCRLKQIIRYKPDKSTDSDLSLRLIDIHQLEKYWQFFNQELSSNLRSHLNENSLENNSSLLESTPSEHETLPCQVETIQLIDSLLKQLIEIIEQNELIRNSSENQQDEIIVSTIKNRTLKRKRKRRSRKCLVTMKRRKQKLSDEQIQWWTKKYSIEPISIHLDRVNVPIDQFI